MSERLWAAVSALTCAVAALVWPHMTPAAEGKKEAGADVFGATKVWQFDLRFAAREWDKIQPPARGVAVKPTEKSADVHKGAYGTIDFPWVHADLTAGEKTYKDVGVRYRGNFTYMVSSRGLKRGLKIDLDHYNSDQRFSGLKMLNLNSGVTDPGRLREALSYAVFRAAGAPASRTAFAEVTLTVPGKYDKEYVGLYTLVEQVDGVFLKAHFGSAKGMLLKPEGVPAGVAHFGDDWRPYEQRYRPRKEPSKTQQKRLVEFTRLVNHADDKQFSKEIGSYLDIDRFLRFLAANALLVNFDSLIGMGHNYYIYLRPDTDKFVFIPWDLDISLGAMPFGGTPEQQMDLSVFHPHMGENKLIDRLLAMKDVNEKYRKILTDLTATCFTKDRLIEDLTAAEKAVKEPLAKEARAVAARKEVGMSPGRFGGSVTLKTFFEKRTESVASQLAGKRKGHVPSVMAFARPPMPGEILPRAWQDQMKLKPKQREKIAELQKEVEERIQKILDDEQKATLRKLKGGRPGGPPNPGRQ